MKQKQRKAGEVPVRETNQAAGTVHVRDRWKQRYGDWQVRLGKEGSVAYLGEAG
jgi:hypothetical protein